MAGLRPQGIQVGPGREALPPAGHLRREVLKARTENLERVADEMINQTDAQMYNVDISKLEEEPEILKHWDVSQHMFTVSNPVKGRVYFWESERPDAIARKKAEARMWLGPGARGWTIVQGEKNADGTEYPEAKDLLQADGTRRIGDTLLMWIPIHEYELIQKRILLAVRFKESNISQTLSEFVRANEGRVHVIGGHDTPEALYQKAHPGSAPLKHTSRAPSDIEVSR